MALKIGIIGVGRFGANHARILAGLPEAELVGISDTNAARAGEIAQAHGTRAFDSMEQLMDSVDAVVAAVPTVSHAKVAGAALERGLPTFVEKPMASTIEEAEALVRKAGDTVLHVGHVERFNPAFWMVHGLLRTPCYIETHRLAPFSHRSTDIDVVLDLMIHDIDIILHVIGSPLKRVDAVGWTLLFGHEDMANARLEFEDGSVANVTTSRVSAVTKRQFRVAFKFGYVSVNFMDRSAEIYTMSDELRAALKDVTPGDAPSESDLKRIPKKFWAVEKLQAEEGEDALTAELKAFIEAARGRPSTGVTGLHGLRAMKVAEAVQKEVREHTWGGQA